MKRKLFALALIAATLATSNAIAADPGDVLTIKWNAGNPGDHVRVMTAVPEPSSWALPGAGLPALGWGACRRGTEA